jgi:hypothetical protein
VDKLLVAGVDTILGANVAAWLANRYQVVGLSWSGPLAIAGCETAECDPAAVDAPPASETWLNATPRRRPAGETWLPLRASEWTSFAFYCFQFFLRIHLLQQAQRDE